MNKMMNYIGLAAVILLAAASSCGNKSKTDKQLIDEMMQESIEAALDSAEEVQMVAEELQNDYLTQDLATFDLRGQVASVKYSGDNTMEPVLVTFNADGSLKSITKFDSEGNGDVAEIERDEKGRIVSISFESNSPWVTMLDYRDDSMLPHSTLDTNNSGNFTSTTYLRDDDGNIVKVEVEEGIHGEMVEQTNEPIIKLTEADSHANWLRYTFTQGDYSTFLIREISYF
jgi:hypothetical protein